MAVFKLLNVELNKDFEHFPVFGLILYSDKDANGYVRNVLLNKDYIQNLDASSGTRWNIFTLKLLSPTRTQYKRSKKSVIMRWVTTLRSFRLDSFHPNLNISKWFDIKYHKELPCLVVFAFHQDTCELLYLKEKIRGENIAETYNYLRKIINEVSDTLENIKEEYLNNKAEIFSQIDWGLKNYKERKVVSKLIKIIDPISLLKKIFSSFKD